MKKRILIIVIVFLLAVGVGIYCWYRQLLSNVEVVSKPLASDAAASAQNVDSTDDPAKGWINILVLGTDNREDEVSRADSIMMVMVNVETLKVSVISIPRDTRVNIEGVGLTKINHANAVGQAEGGVHEGTLKTAEAVSNLLEIDTNYYVKIDFEGFQKAVDAVDGIDVNLPYDVQDWRIDLAAGEQHLTGEQALLVARSRYGLAHGDFDRQELQFLLLSSLAHKMLSISNVSRLPEQLQIVYSDLLDTNMSIPEMLAKGMEFKGIKKEDIQYFQLPGKGITAYDPLVGANVYYYESDMDGVREVVSKALE
ncbi:LCP family protein [Dehalobacter sp. UNSWDHB]|uniref:LCP family protein n=1 Tax=Dehalobacter sp. UNSWDHB TaxID=1339256 RepID=UPI0005529E93|nr:LCP family protein [Dehalobacter sp. UNSWDHB]